MATYYGASEMQSDGLQTLYLMNPGYVGYSDPQTPASANMVFLNSAGNPLNPANLPHPSQQNHHFVGIPLQAPASSQDHNRPSVHNQHDISSVHGFVPRVHYNLWTPMDQAGGAAAVGNHHQIATTSAGGGSGGGGGGISDMTSLLGLRRSVGPPPPAMTASQQGLSLSLSPQQPVYGSYRQEPDVPAPAPPPAISPASGDDMRISGSSSSASAVSNGISGLQSVLMGSKYLKAAQQLLDEVVSVGKDFKTDSNKGSKGQLKGNRDSPAAEPSSGAEINGKRAAELTTAERQELQMKKAKLISMLDEVEQRYRQYHHQMQIVVSSFEAAAGIGSAKTYTALALQTISKQFRCLRDAITGQIRATSRSLGEEDCLGGGKGEGSSSRLRFVDQHIRQQRALQQLGMMQNNAWRPQRGLPERSVSVLRAWLFEHFLHPYPKDSDKHMLAKQTGLTRSQVSNWFINARVRLWKPMVEEMYLEETKEQEQNGSEDKASKSEINEDMASKSMASQETCPIGTEQMNGTKAKAENANDSKAPLNGMSNSPGALSATMGNARNQTCFSLIGSSSSDAHTQASYHDSDGMLQGHPKKARIGQLESLNTIASMETDLKSDEDNDKEIYMMKFSSDRPTRDGYSLIPGNGGQGGGFGAYSIGEIGRFDPEQFTPRFSGNGVSLTLGLPHCENISLSGTQQTYLSNQNIPLGRRLEMGNETNDFCSINTPSATHSANAYESINIQNRKRFAAQLLPDFVA